MNELGNTPADKNYKPSGISKAEERALEAYPVQMVSGPIGYEEPKFDINAFGRDMFIEGYEQATQDIVAIIESRLSEILGDAQPKPALRAELQELIKRIKEERK